MPFVDARDHPGDTLEADLAVVGSGPAGLAIAREFVGTRWKVVLIEAGSFKPRRRTQLDYLGRNTGRANIGTAISRFRCFGGSTTRWGGQCRPLDPIDFQQREGVAHSGWPFDLQHLLPYYRRAQEFCQLGRVNFWAESALSTPSSLLDTRTYGFSDPLDLGLFYREDFRAADNVTVFLNGNLLEIQCDSTGTKVVGLRVGRLGGRSLRVVASCFVIACGGIENARLLLASNRVHQRGLGNGHDLVGRFFTDHPYIFPGYFEPAGSAFPPPGFVLDSYHAGQRNFPTHAAWGLSERILREERLNGASLYLVPRRRYKTLGPYWSPGGRAVLHLSEVLQWREHLDGRLMQDLAALVSDFPNVLRTMGGRLAGVVTGRNVLAIRIALEATPCPESRVTLGRATDRWGMPRVEVHWRLNPDDLRGYHRLLDVVQSETVRLGIGRVIDHGRREPDGWPGGMIGGKHHMGTTRMHPDPSQGVVDADCRVHEVLNLFVAGSSVFPTGGYANPTLTIVALALRLADRLKTALGTPSERIAGIADSA